MDFEIHSTRTYYSSINPVSGAQPCSSNTNHAFGAQPCSLTTNSAPGARSCFLSTNYTHDAYLATTEVRNTAESLGRNAKNLPINPRRLSDYDPGPEMQKYIEHNPGPNGMGHGPQTQYTESDHDPGPEIQTNVRTITIQDYSTQIMSTQTTPQR